MADTKIGERTPGCLAVVDVYENGYRVGRRACCWPNVHPADGATVFRFHLAEHPTERQLRIVWTDDDTEIDTTPKQEA